MGEVLTLANGQTATVTSCRVEKLTTPVRVYNFEVADWHTYHVGSANGQSYRLQDARKRGKGGSRKPSEDDQEAAQAAPTGSKES